MKYKVLSANFLYEKLGDINVGDNIPEDRLRDVVDKSIIKFLIETKAIEEVVPVYVDGENFFAVEPFDVDDVFEVEEPGDALADLENHEKEVNLDRVLKWFTFDFREYILKNNIFVPDYDDLVNKELIFNYKEIIKSVGHFSAIADFRRIEEIATRKEVVLHFLQKGVEERVDENGVALLDHENLDGTFDKESYEENISQFDLKLEYLSFLEVLKCFAPKYAPKVPIDLVARIDRLKDNVKARKTLITKKSEYDWEIKFLD